MADSGAFSSDYLRLRDALLGAPCGRRRLFPDRKDEMEEESMKMVTCPLCGMEVPELMYELHDATDRMVIARMQERFPGWQPEEGGCEPCIERFRRLEGDR